MKFSHSGAIGDIIYHLAVVQYLGGGEFYITPSDMRGYMKTKESLQFTTLQPLIEAQPYITKCDWSDVPLGINMDGWRNALDFSKNLTQQMADYLCLNSDFDDSIPWIHVEGENKVAEVVIARAPRINLKGPDWRRMVKLYGKKAIFLGLADEHEAFCDMFGFVPRYYVPDMLEAARVIKGSQFAICNASSMAALCEGLKHRIMLSSHPDIDCAVYFDRPDMAHCLESFPEWELK